MKTTAETRVTVDACGLLFKDLNTKLRDAVSRGVDVIELKNVCGQRYIGTDLDRPVTIDIQGTPGNDLGMFMNGPRITVHGNAQDGCGNTMNEGEIVIEGHAGDIIGMSARGGKIFVRDNVGYRAAIHMKEYRGKKPMVVVGGTAQDFAGEYMAGGVLALLGLTLNGSMHHKADFIGTGMHAGVIYIRGTVDDYQVGKEVGMGNLDDADRKVLNGLLAEYGAHFGLDTNKILGDKYIKLTPKYLRPYGRLYAY
jgi:glutamate synthase domain-containing protein 3